METKTESSESNSKKTILLVEHEEESRNEILTHLLKLGYQVATASNTTDALKSVENNPPQLIVSAFDLPDRDGLNFRELLLKNPKQAQIPFILITATDGEEIEHRVKAVQLNIPHFLTKPLEFETFSAQIEAVFSLKAESERIMEEEKLKAIKQLSVTMNHEIKNHLSTILGNAELIQMKYPELGPDIEAKLTKIRKAGKEIKQVLDNLNILSKLTTTMYVSKVEMLQIVKSKSNEEEQS